MTRRGNQQKAKLLFSQNKEKPEGNVLSESSDETLITVDIFLFSRFLLTKWVTALALRQYHFSEEEVSNIGFSIFREVSILQGKDQF